MATWPTTLPAPQKNISIVPGDTRIERKLQSGRTEFRRFGDGKPDQLKVPFRLTWVEWDIFEEFHARDLNLGLNWFSASWLTTLGYSVHKAKILGYPREVARQGYYIDIICTLLIQKTAWITSVDTSWPCAATGAAPPPPDEYGYIYGGLSSSNRLQDCDQYIPDTWTSKTDLPTPTRYNLAASTLGSSSYVYGGYSTSNLSDTDQYTPDTWVSVLDMLVVDKQFAASTIDSHSYIYGGYYNKLNCDQYTYNAWVSKTDIPSPNRRQLAASTIGSSGYIYAGYYSKHDCTQYTPDTWVSKTDLPAPDRYELAASTIGSSGYVYGGYSPALQDCDQYTPDTWVSKTNMPAPGRYGLTASTISNKGYIYGGYYYSGGSYYLQDCDEYTLDTWVSRLDIPVPARQRFAASTI